MRLRLARRAYADLDEIKDQSRSRWGLGQTKKYVAGIDAVMRRLCDTPYHFPELPDRPTHRKARSGQHLIIFRVDPDADMVNVIRILHERMDIDAQLEG